MGVFTQKSQIEFIRRRRHGIASRFRFLKDGQDGYLIIGELTRSFYLNRKFDTQIGARVEHLIFDAPVGFNREIIELAIFGDLVKEDGTSRRYTITTETEPTAMNENRFRFLVTAAFSDTTPIVGVATPDGDVPIVTETRFVHIQATPATVWNVNHNLGEKVIAQVVDSNGEILFAPMIVHVSLNQLQVTFDLPVSGEVRIL